jgi:uncharacterized protein (TIRG00374 family)
MGSDVVPGVESPTGPEIVERPPALRARLKQRRTWLSFLVGFGLLFLAIRRLEVDPAAIWATIRQADVRLYLLGLLVFYLTFVFRSLRWRKLLRNVGYRARDGVRLPPLRRLAEIILLSWFVNCLVPARLGDAYRAYLLKQDADVSFSKTFGTVLAERILDLIALFCLLGLAAVVLFGAALPTVVLSLVEVALLLAVLLIVGLAAMRLFGGRIRAWLPLRFHRQYGLFEEGTLRSFQGLPVLGVYTVLAWAMEAGRLHFVMLSLGLDRIHPAVPLFISLAGALLTAVPFTPAGLGFVESGMVSLLLLLGGLGLIGGMSREAAISVAVLDRTISYWSIIIVGAVLQVRRSTR